MGQIKIALFCGGVGTRMWPMSRKELPKQFQPLIGETSMFQQAVSRLSKGFDHKDMFVFTGENHIPLAKKQAPQIPVENFLGEPELRDTHASVGLAATLLDKLFPDCTMVGIWASDHLVKDEEEFIRAIKAAKEVAEKDSVMVNIDVWPTFPNVHNGYIKIGEVVETIDGYKIYEFLGQVEKPDYETAKKFLESKTHLIHTGYFVWKTSLARQLYQKYDPETAKILAEIKKTLRTPEENKKLPSLYSQIEKKAVDYGLFEMLGPKEARDIPADFGWTDVGTWELFLNGMLDNPEDNLTKGDLVTLDTKGSLIFGDKNKLTAVIGLEDMVVIDTKDALLICPKSKSQDVKKIVERLREEKKDKYL
ncbi:mannose-1-phosphate guanylyltransferase [Candidatus Daviesbacteria bacterium]|nr:mannose-1-phosphate guanylyltransferase [Candidatus Daviesbacteria bacterium]